MDKLRGAVSKHASKLKYLFVLGALIAGLNTLSRADYNFAIYLYMLYVWAFLGNTRNKNQDKGFCFFILIFSLFVDFFWCFYWKEKWAGITSLMHWLSLVLSWTGIFLKIAIIVMIAVLEWSVIKNTPATLSEKIAPDSYLPQIDEQI